MACVTWSVKFQLAQQRFDRKTKQKQNAMPATKENQMRRFTAHIAIFALCVMGADTQAPAPKSAAATAAIHKSDLAENAALETYDKSVAKARKTEADELKIAMKAAIQKGDLDEANAINAVLKSIAVNADGPVPPTPSLIGGRWKTNNGASWVITATEVRHDNPGQSPSLGGTPSVKGHIMTVKWPDGYVDQLTFEGDKFFLEGWSRGHAADEAPRNLLVGHRIVEENQR